MFRMIVRGLFGGFAMIGVMTLLVPRRPVVVVRTYDDVANEVWDVLAEARRIVEESA